MFVYLGSVLNLITRFDFGDKWKLFEAKNERCPSVGGRRRVCLEAPGEGAKRLIIFIDRKKVPDLAWTLTTLLGRFQLFTDILLQIPKNTGRRRDVVLILCLISTSQL